MYVVRRRLGFEVTEWDALPWWEQRMYIEGLRREANDGDRPAPVVRPTLSDGDAALAGLGVDLETG